MKPLREFAVKAYLVVIAGITISLNCMAQDTARNLQLGIDLVKIASAFQELKQTSVTVAYRLSKAGNNSNSFTDTSIASFLLDKGKMMGVIQGVTILRNEKHCLTIDPDESIIAIGDNNAGSSVFDVKNYDSILRQNGMIAFDRQELAGGFYRLDVSFPPDAYYKRFEMIYDRKFLLQSVVVETVDLDFGEDGLPPPAGSRKVMEVAYGPYSFSEIDASIFDVGRFIKKADNGKWAGVGSYSGWEIIDMESTQ